MTDTSWLFLAAAGIFAASDWFAIATYNKPLEYFAKPAAMIAILGVALAGSPHIEGRRWAFVVAIVFSLLGDVLLMLPRDYFVAGLGSFLIAHLAYIAGLRIGASELRPLVLSAVPVTIAAVLIGARVLRSLHDRHPDLIAPVSAYIGVIAVMVSAALATGEPLAAFGAVLFMASDSLIAWNRFVTPMPWAPVTIMVTYHLAQGLLVLSLAL